MTAKTPYLTNGDKTTKAKTLEKEFNAIRFTPDEWIVNIYGNELDVDQCASLRKPVEDALWILAITALKIGRNVIVDYGLWMIEERKKFREIGQNCGAQVYFVYCHEPFDILWHRISSRPESLSGTLQLTKELLQSWYDSFQPLIEEENQSLYLP